MGDTGSGILGVKMWNIGGKINVEYVRLGVVEDGRLGVKNVEYVRLG